MITEEIQKQFKVFHSIKNSTSSNLLNPKKIENNQIFKNETFVILNASNKSLGKAPINKLSSKRSSKEENEIRKNSEENDWDNLNEKGKF